MSCAPRDGASERITAVKPARGAIVAAFVTLYLVWGSTYLGIRIAVETLPPFLLAGARFALAGTALLIWTRLRGVPFPVGREWFAAARVGACLILLSNVPIVWVEQKIASGVVALFAAGTPLLIAVFNRRRTGMPLGKVRGTGLALGTAGMVLLGSATFEMVREPLPLAMLALASFSWAIGSTFGRDWGGHKDLLMGSAAQMLAGGMLAIVVSILSGELAHLDPHRVTWQSVAAWSYLAVFGSLLAYPVFQWLLSVADATAVASYTYVNPIIALALGATIMGERLTTRTLIATAVLIPAVVLVVTGGARKELEVPQEE